MIYCCPLLLQSTFYKVVVYTRAKILLKVICRKYLLYGKPHIYLILPKHNNFVVFLVKQFKLIYQNILLWIYCHTKISTTGYACKPHYPHMDIIIQPRDNT